MTWRYLFVLLIAFLIPVTAVAAINFGADPFIYRWPRPSAVPVPAFASFDREVHLNLATHARARSILLGNSQVQHALSPEHWDVARPTINGAAVGMDMSEMRRVLDRAQTNGPVDAALLGVDFSSTRVIMLHKPPVFEDYVVNSDGSTAFRNFKSYFSFAMLKVSLQRVWNRLSAAPQFYANDGQALDALYETIVAASGGSLRAMKGRLSQYRQNLEEAAFDYKAEMRAVRDDACRGHTRLEVILTPVHIAWIETIIAAGRESDWDNWKRDLAIISKERADCTFDVWDFNTYNSVTTESLSNFDPKQGLKYSWDGVHIKRSVGDRILGAIATQGRPSEDDFGVRLTPDTIEATLAAGREARGRYLAAHSDEMRLIRSFAQ